MGLVDETEVRARDVTTCSMPQTQLNVRLLDFALGAPLERVCGVRGHALEG